MNSFHKNKPNFPKLLYLLEVWNQNLELLANIKIKTPVSEHTMLILRPMDKKLLSQAKLRTSKFCKSQDQIQSSNHRH